MTVIKYIFALLVSLPLIVLAVYLWVSLARKIFPKKAPEDRAGKESGAKTDKAYSNRASSEGAERSDRMAPLNREDYMAHHTDDRDPWRYQ